MSEQPTDKLWCAWCGVWGDHQSGSCKDLKSKLDEDAIHPPFLRVVIETHDSRLEMDTRCGTAQFIEARAIEAIRAGSVGILIASKPTTYSEER